MEIMPASYLASAERRQAHQRTQKSAADASKENKKYLSQRFESVISNLSVRAARSSRFQIGDFKGTPAAIRKIVAYNRRRSIKFARRRTNERKRIMQNEREPRSEMRVTSVEGFWMVESIETGELILLSTLENLKKPNEEKPNPSPRRIYAGLAKTVKRAPGEPLETHFGKDGPLSSSGSNSKSAARVSNRKFSGSK